MPTTIAINGNILAWYHSHFVDELDMIKSRVKLLKSMFAAVVGDVFKTLDEAQKVMGSGFGQVYQPIPENVEKYKVLYQKYQG